MSADHVAVLVAAVAAATTAAALVFVVVALRRQVRDLRRAVDDLTRETVPLVRDARVVVDQAATEMVRVGDVLESTEAVSATVDSASRLAYRTLANPAVKLVAYTTGVGTAFRRLFSRRPADARRPRPVVNGARQDRTGADRTGAEPGGPDGRGRDRRRRGAEPPAPVAPGRAMTHTRRHARAPR